MAIALDLYREPPKSLPAGEREIRRRLFWAVYIMDRFLTCGSKRPGLIADHSIVLRLPAWSPHTAGLNVEGELFNNVGPNIQYSSDPRRKPAATALLIDITRILGITNRYLAAGASRVTRTSPGTRCPTCPRSVRSWTSGLPVPRMCLRRWKRCSAIPRAPSCC